MVISPVPGHCHSLQNHYTHEIIFLIIYRERGNRALAVVLQSRHFLRLRNAFKNSVAEASKLVSTKTLLLKHHYRRQGLRGLHYSFRGFFELIFITVTVSLFFDRIQLQEITPVSDFQ